MGKRKVALARKWERMREGPKCIYVYEIVKKISGKKWQIVLQDTSVGKGTCHITQI